MRRFLLASAATLAMVCGASSLSAQTPAAAATAATAMTAEQKSAYESWPADQKASYDSWPADYQAYYWSLSSNQQTGWWALTDDQRKKILAMDAPTRAAAWVSIEKQLTAANATPSADPAMPPTQQVQANPRGEGPASAAAPNPQSAEAAVPPSMPADPGYQAGPYKGALTEPPAEAQNKTYPVCSRKVQDSCRNRGGV